MRLVRAGLCTTLKGARNRIIGCEIPIYQNLSPTLSGWVLFSTLHVCAQLG